MLARGWYKRITWPNIPQLKLGKILGYNLRDITQFSNLTVHHEESPLKI